MSANPIISRNPNTCFTQASPDEIVILNTQNHQFYRLNATGVFLWLALEKPHAEDELVQLLSKQYGKTKSAYQQDVQEWVQQMSSLSLIDYTHTQASLSD